MMQAKAYRGHLVIIVESRAKSSSKNLCMRSPNLLFLYLNSLWMLVLGRGCTEQRVGNVVLEKSVITEPVRLIMVLTKAEGKLVINAGDDSFVTQRGMFSPMPLNCKAIRFLLNRGLNSLNDKSAGPPPLITKRLLSARRG